jgi:hypothetical protein
MAKYNYMLGVENIGACKPVKKYKDFIDKLKNLF